MAKFFFQESTDCLSVKQLHEMQFCACDQPQITFGTCESCGKRRHVNDEAVIIDCSEREKLQRIKQFNQMIEDEGYELSSWQDRAIAEVLLRKYDHHLQNCQHHPCNIKACFSNVQGSLSLARLDSIFERLSDSQKRAFYRHGAEDQVDIPEGQLQEAGDPLDHFLTAFLTQTYFLCDSKVNKNYHAIQLFGIKSKKNGENNRIRDYIRLWYDHKCKEQSSPPLAEGKLMNSLQQILGTALHLANSYIDEFMGDVPEKDTEYQKLAKVIGSVAIYEITGDISPWPLCSSSLEKMDTPFAFLMKDTRDEQQKIALHQKMTEQRNEIPSVKHELKKANPSQNTNLEVYNWFCSNNGHNRFTSQNLSYYFTTG